MFAEIDPVLARDRGIEDGGWMTIMTARGGDRGAGRKVTDRIRPLKVDRRLVHQVALPWHWGYAPPHTGDSTNDLGVISGDPNTSIQESKAFTCDVRAGRRSRASTAGLAGAPPGRHIRPRRGRRAGRGPEGAAE